MEFRNAMTTNREVFEQILFHMRDAVDLFNKMAQRPEWSDKPIGEGIMFQDWRIAAETGKMVTATMCPLKEPNIGSLAELSAQSWMLIEEQQDVDSVLTTADVARSEFCAAKDVWNAWFPKGTAAWQTTEGNVVRNRWHRANEAYEETKVVLYPRFVAWHARAARFGLGLSELFDDIPEHELERFHKLVAQIHKVYEASVDLLRTSTNGHETQTWGLWQDYFYNMADRLNRKAVDFQKREDQQNVMSAHTCLLYTSDAADE